MSGIVGVCPECGFSLRAHRTRVESVLDHAPWCPSIARKDPQIPACSHCATLRTELAQAKDENEDLRAQIEASKDAERKMGNAVKIGVDALGMWRVRCEGVLARAGILRADLATCRTALQELAEAAGKLAAEAGSVLLPPLPQKHLDGVIGEVRALITRAEEEGKR